MSAISLEQRVAALEAEVASLKAKMGQKDENAPWWHQIAGTFANDPRYEEAMRLGRKWRESFRPTSARKK